jgi:hypothetical protein
MRLAIGLLSAAIMLFMLAAVTGSPVAHARTPARVLRLSVGNHPHPCTPYAGCDVLQLTASAGPTAP